jgi:hypothetical protein
MSLLDIPLSWLFNKLSLRYGSSESIQAATSLKEAPVQTQEVPLTPTVAVIPTAATHPAPQAPSLYDLPVLEEKIVQLLTRPPTSLSCSNRVLGWYRLRDIHWHLLGRYTGDKDWELYNILTASTLFETKYLSGNLSIRLKTNQWPLEINWKNFHVLLAAYRCTLDGKAITAQNVAEILGRSPQTARKKLESLAPTFLRLDFSESYWHLTITPQQELWCWEKSGNNKLSSLQRELPTAMMPATPVKESVITFQTRATYVASKEEATKLIQEIDTAIFTLEDIRDQLVHLVFPKV